MRIAVTALLMTATSSTACGSSSPASGTDVATIAGVIDPMDAQVQGWFDREMTDSIVTGYSAADSIVMNPNAPAMKGSEAMRRGLTEIFNTVDFHLRFKRDTLIAEDSMASDQGHYTLELRTKSDTSKVIASDYGSYVTTFVKRNGEWRAIFDIVTSEVPMPAGNR